MGLSLWFLSLSLKTLPRGISYAIWSGIGTVGTVIFGMIWLGESASVIKLLCVALIVIGMVGLKLIT
jgi:quaternary ammonium compound-resistance protein SugE